MFRFRDMDDDMVYHIGPEQSDMDDDMDGDMDDDMDDDMVYHLGHEHPLTSGIFGDPYLVDCKVCLRRLRKYDEFYSCHICWSYFIHGSCVHEMPHRIQHSFHRDHNLTPSLSKKFQCFSCKEKFREVVSFQCSECDFFLCIECALKPDICDRNEGQNGNLICHEQPMRVEEKKHEDGIECYACHLPCSGPTFTCKTCNYFFHNSCLELPPQIHYPSHPQHPLRRHMASPGQSTITKCKACHRSCPFFIVFQCNECDFNICPKCTSLKPTIKHQDHIHSLCLMEETYKNSADRCDGYDTYCRKEAVINNEFMKYMLRCVECDFSLHLLCGRLPSSIKHEYHVHLLALVDSLIEDDSEEYYCDICEKKRDPRICIYYCAECRYIAQVHCVLSKVIEVLEGDVGDVKLRKVGEWINMSGIVGDQGEGATHDGNERKETLQDLINKLSEEETKQLKQLFEWNDNDNMLQIERFEHLQGGNKHGEENSDDNEELYVDNADEFLEKINKRLSDRSIRLKLESTELGSELVNVKGFKIPSTLAPVLKDVIDEYGNIVAPQIEDFSPAMCNIIYFVICRLLNSVCRTRVIDISVDLLQHWICHFYFLWVVIGIDEIDFLNNPLDKLINAYMGLQMKRNEKEALEKLPEKIENLRRKLKKYEERLDKVRGNKIVAKSDQVEECLEGASQFNKWETGRHLFFS